MKIAVNFVTRNFYCENKVTGLPQHHSDDLSETVVQKSLGTQSLKVRVVYRGGSSLFFGIGIFTVSDTAGIGIFGQYSRCVGKISSFMVPLSKNIYITLKTLPYSSLHFLHIHSNIDV